MMVLYSGTTCPFSQRCRLVLFEKGMDFEVRDVDLFNKPEDISTMNPYGQVPILVERELILYESNIINEYIDERFPHPQLMPADPLMRARARLMLFNFEKELFVHVHVLESERAKTNDKSHDKARAEIRDRLTTLAPLFLKNKYMLGDEFSMLDVAVAPLLWRLDHYGIELSKTAAPLMKYAERIFKFDILQVKRLSVMYFFMVGKWHLTRSIGDVGGHFSLLFKKVKNKWVIVADHSS